MAQHGWADEGFGAVADAFARNFAEGRELGSAVAVFAGGRKVVDLWGGTADGRTGRAWDEDTVLPVMSVAKGLISVCAHLLAQQGTLDLDAPVADHWPEFAQRGKEAITSRMVLANTAGIPLVERQLTFEELTRWTPVIRALEEQQVLYEPGTAFEYHAHAFGFLIGELIRRLTGRTPGRYFRETIGDALGLRTWIGLPQEEVPRLARLAEAAGRSPLPSADLLPMRALTMNGVLPFPGLDDPHGYNSPALLTAEFPGAGAVSSARGLAALYAAVATGVDGAPRLLGADTVTDAVRQVSGGASWSGFPDLGARWGSGFLIDSPFRRLLGARSFGNSGAGGQFAFGDDEFGVGFAYTANLMGAGADPRVDRLIGAVRTCVGAPEPAEPVAGS
ncbi:serine hydrolase domain-containing protein [Streptomyces sp. P9-2B-2]|uniref:serine hydrolase domain-containing protein n=1 Tax=Streptomyces sp. P9-2B-2 TaxID=3057114 RepID=UPI0025B3BBF8|nr:serine hydrolase domain-containing protein [Streptomyces sp. P9-2B-2]WJY40645.1 serine hydrolase domain-containing protein [Streptomyces sp. P9-2B-2]